MAECLSPYWKKLYKWSLEESPLPCGKCPTCKQRRISSWCFRLEQEDKVSDSAYFVTLTYNTESIPISKNGFPTLVRSKRSVNKKGNLVWLPHEKSPSAFIKRLRKTQKTKLKYYIVGEYGGSKKYGRPHYHIILFNLENAIFIGRNAKGYPEYKSKEIEKSWQYGTVNVRGVGGASIRYTLAYIEKETTVPLHKRDDRLKEYSLMSKGLGKSYLTNAVINYHKADISRNYLSALGNYKIPMPKYYRDRIYTEQEKELQRQIIEEQRQIKEQKVEDEYKKYVKNKQKSLESYIFSKTEAKHYQFYSKSKNKRDGIENH